jgi:hypothetical protein
MIRGLPLHIGFFMGWADRFRPSLRERTEPTLVDFIGQDSD